MQTHHRCSDRKRGLTDCLTHYMSSRTTNQYRLAMSGEQVAPIEMPHICSYVTEACLINNRDFTAICIHIMIVCLSCCGTPSQSANSKIHQDAHEFKMESQVQLSFNPTL